MTSLEEYREADYDIDMYFDKTTSWPDGLQEMYRFEPNLPRPVKRTSSADDVQRYRDHFIIAQRNQGESFTWKHYLKVLGDDLRHFDTLVLMSKALLKSLDSPRDSEISHYVTASESELTEKQLPRYKLIKRMPLFKTESAGDTDSLSTVGDISINSNVSFTPQKNLLKKFCSEIRHLACKTYKTVQKMSVKSKYCSACGDYITNVKIHEDCSQSLLNQSLVDCKKPITPSMLKGTNLTRMLSMSLSSVTSIGSGESAVNQQSMEHVSPYRKKKACPKRMLPFIKESSEGIKR